MQNLEGQLISNLRQFLWGNMQENTFLTTINILFDKEYLIQHRHLVYLQKYIFYSIHIEQVVLGG